MSPPPPPSLPSRQVITSLPQVRSCCSLLGLPNPHCIATCIINFEPKIDEICFSCFPDPFFPSYISSKFMILYMKSERTNSLSMCVRVTGKKLKLSGTVFPNGHSSINSRERFSKKSLSQKGCLLTL